MEDQSNPFPVEWESPEDAQAFWIIDVVHCPVPIHRLDYDLRMLPLLTGANTVNERFGLPLGAEPRLIHGFIYQKIISRELAPEAVPGVLAAADAAVRRGYVDLQGRWEKEWLPEIHDHLGALDGFDSGAAPLPALLAHLGEVRRRVVRLWELHNELLLPVIVALSDFDQAYRDLFPEAKPLDAYELLAGFANKTVEANLHLWELGREAARSPSLRALVVDGPPEALAAALAGSDEGRALWSRIKEYSFAYGERNDDLFLDRPTWVEDPTPILRGLREAVLQPDRDLAVELRQQASRREARLGEVRAALASHPRPVVEEFEALLRAAQTATVLSEDHHFWIDCKVTHHARRVAVEVGHRLAERGALDAAADVFHLSLAELETLADPAAASAHLHASIAAQKAEAARFAGVTPPMILGVPRPFLPMDCAVMRASFKFSGNFMAPPGEGPDLQGMPGSAGKVTGPARIVRTLDDAGRLKPGDILVASFTLPSWTPFFASAAGVVTNIGGMLCHAAVVAREYGIPAVVGTARATEVLRDGEIIEVDGDMGVVRRMTP